MEKIEKTLIATMFALVLLVSMTTASAATVTNPPITSGLLSVGLAKYEPFPADAGEFVHVWIDVDNVGIEPVDNVTFVLEPKYPFTLPDKDPIRYFSSITGLDDIRLEYRLLVDKDAPNATSKVIIRYYEDDKAGKEKTFNIRVKESGEEEDRVDLKALFVEAEPTPYPGAKVKLTIDLVNTDDGTAYHTIAIAETEIANIERNAIFIGDLEADDFDSVDFDLIIRNDAGAGKYPVNITAIYKNEDAVEIRQSSIVYISVISAEDAARLRTAETPAWMIALYIIVIIIILRAVLYPFVKWFIKPFRRKKSV